MGRLTKQFHFAVSHKLPGYDDSSLGFNFTVKMLSSNASASPSPSPPLSIASFISTYLNLASGPTLARDLMALISHMISAIKSRDHYMIVM